jgi:hypothetical protein
VQKIHKLGDVYVLDDCGDKDLKFLLKYKVELFRNPVHNGKEGFYLTVTDLFNLMVETNYDYYFFLPDDLIPIDGFHLKAIEQYRAIKDNRKICLNMFLEKSRYLKACWTGFEPRIREHVILSNWVDMCFMCERRMLEVLNYEIRKPETDWKITPTLSSGVGKYISRMLVLHRHLRIYQVRSSLFKSAPESFESKMHPTRKKDHLIYKEIINDTSANSKPTGKS